MKEIINAMKLRKKTEALPEALPDIEMEMSSGRRRERRLAIAGRDREKNEVKRLVYKRNWRLTWIE